MNPLALFKPEYLYRPSQFVRRVRAAIEPQTEVRREVALTFGGRLHVWSNDVIGRAILHLGVYDLAVSEVLWRLTEPGETVVDICANIGYFTRLLGTRAGPTGMVVAFEPHPVLFEELQSNVEAHGPLASPTWDLHCLAASSASGSVDFAVPEQFRSNRGVCRVVTGVDSSANLEVFQVGTVTLDDVFDPGLRIGVVKMDVEGHEASVVAGADRILSTRQVRDWVFEDLTEGSLITDLFEEAGYEVLLIERQINRPRLERRHQASLKGRWEPPSFLATMDGRRAERLCAASGWQVLRRR